MIDHFLFSTMQGMGVVEWSQTLVQRRFRIHPVYWLRALLLTVTSVLVSVLALAEWLLFGWFVRRTEVKAPIFILGHFRSGTTHLHNLLALDPAHSAPTLFQVLLPRGFLLTETLLHWPARLLFLKRRPQDNMTVDPTVPSEDEIAIAIHSGRSPYMAFAFPRDSASYQKYLTLENLDPSERVRWKRSLLAFLKRVTWKTGKPLLLKSPPHTARVKYLLELFPDARFVHIHRNPYEVFLSTRRLHQKLTPYFALQRWDDSQFDDAIIRTYQEMHDSLLDQTSLIPPGQFCEISFEELEREPMTTLSQIYRTLELPGFDALAPRFEAYLDSLRDYQKNRHPGLPVETRRRLDQAWSRFFLAWGYPQLGESPTSRPHFGTSRPAAEREDSTQPTS
ncbi:MAG: sulfotransferase [Isosphaeraceae bacterium]